MQHLWIQMYIYTKKILFHSFLNELLVVNEGPGQQRIIKLNPEGNEWTLVMWWYFTAPLWQSTRRPHRALQNAITVVGVALLAVTQSPKQLNIYRRLNVKEKTHVL